MSEGSVLTARILIDNETKSALLPEWGLSVLIEFQGHRILLDTGASDKFLQNADSLGTDLSTVEFGVLSHAHYDHADGMAAFFGRNKTAPFYLRKGSRENCYSGTGEARHYIGIQRGLLKEFAGRLVYVDGDYEAAPGVFLLPHKIPGLERIGRAAELFLLEGEELRPDSFAHEQSLVFDTARGLVIFNSCSHGGADNIIREIQEMYPDKNICAVIGGFHLYKMDDGQVRAFARRVRDTGIEKIYTGHCTGERAYQILREELGERVQQIYTGMEICI